MCFCSRLSVGLGLTLMNVGLHCGGHHIRARATTVQRDMAQAINNHAIHKVDSLKQQKRSGNVIFMSLSLSPSMVLLRTGYSS